MILTPNLTVDGIDPKYLRFSGLPGLTLVSSHSRTEWCPKISRHDESCNWCHLHKNRVEKIMSTSSIIFVKYQISDNIRIANAAGILFVENCEDLPGATYLFHNIMICSAALSDFNRGEIGKDIIYWALMRQWRSASVFWILFENSDVVLRELNCRHLAFYVCVQQIWSPIFDSLHRIRNRQVFVKLNRCVGIAVMEKNK